MIPAVEVEESECSGEDENYLPSEEDAGEDDDEDNAEEDSEGDDEELEGGKKAPEKRKVPAKSGKSKHATKIGRADILATRTTTSTSHSSSAGVSKRPGKKKRCVLVFLSGAQHMASHDCAQCQTSSQETEEN